MGLTDDIFAKRGSWQLFRTVGGYDLSTADAGYIDKHGRLWLRLPHALLCTDGVHVVRCYQPECMHTNLPFTSGFCANDIFWVITEEKRLLALRLEDGLVEDHTEHLPSLAAAYFLWTSSHDDILIGLPGRLIRYDGCRAKSVRVPGPEDARIRCAGTSIDGDVWITVASGLYLLEGECFRHCPLPNGQNAVLWDFLAGPNKTLWLPLREKLLYLENGRFCEVLQDELQYMHSAGCLRIDRDQNAWFSIHFRGTICVSREGVVVFPFEDTPGVWWPKNMVQDHTGAFWHIGVQNGILRYDPRGMSVVQRGHIEAIVPRPQGRYVVAAASRGLLECDGEAAWQICGSLPSRIYSLFVDANEDIYVCSASGLFLYDSVNGKMVQHGLVNAQDNRATMVYNVVRDCNDLFWINALGLLWCEGPDGVVSYSHDSLRMERRLFMFCDDQGVLWLVSGQDMPVLRFNKGTFEVVREQFKPDVVNKPDDRISSLTQDAQGTFWAGSRDACLFRFSPETGIFTEVSIPGLSGGVRHVRVEASGEMWICTTKGLFRHDGQHTYRMTELNFLPSHRAVASYRIDDETVLIATELGVCRCHPRYDTRPEIYISKVIADQTYDSPGESLTCQESAILSVHLTAWNVKPGPLVYRYRLMGHEDKWTETMEEVYTFHALPSGTYQFEAEAFDEDLMFCKQRVALSLEIIPNQQEVQIAALEGELEDARAYAENILRSMHDLVVVLDVDGVIVTVNPAMTKLLGYAAREAIGKTPQEVLFRGGACPVGAAGIAKLRRVRHFEAQEVELHARDGSILPAILSAFCLYDTRGMLQGFVLTASDISEYKELQQQFLQSQKMKSLGMLAGGIAHDFNNLLGVMIGNADMMRECTDAQSPDYQCLGDIIGAGKQASKLCAEMLMYCGKGNPIRKPLDLSAIVRENAELLKSSIARKIEIHYTLAEDLPLVWGDEVQIMQIVLNLVVNASEAIGDDSGTINLRTYLASPPSDRSAKSTSGGDAHAWVALEVSDTGKGMDQQTLERIFEPFFSTKFTGRGLGLAAIHGIVKSHNGELTVHSTPGKGTTFDVYLPISEQQHTEDMEDKPMKATAVSGTVLLVEDEDTLRDLCRRMLERIGFDVVEATHGGEALEQVTENKDRITVVFLDITMPVMDGYEAYAKMREQCPALPIVLMSGFAEQDIEDHVPKDDHVYVLKKPFTRQRLLDVLSAVQDA